MTQSTSNQVTKPSEKTSLARSIQPLFFSLALKGVYKKEGKQQIKSISQQFEKKQHQLFVLCSETKYEGDKL